eukprot:Gregarina_sp_Poly_1__691@NODE_1164_length_4884_cov_102_741540_g799_i0_p1_GENE_NODE_1164_length_4884_cov_102_741540_g799_i0NODE_1164_length_4884_cov_102_741540_g799_i0_p1_ORF_typecomplete_len672_score82_30zfRING_2/PF13639_6/1_3e04zfRING_2/PF13639_6/5_8e05zfRING_11/PF17123_5/1_4e04zfRING_11/PF17123_5/0_00024zfRING_UBOX/PF13445_6/0_00067zfC3HC4/PF00097_25/0_0053zfC3HC4_2/PF13923_6/5_1e03zfC3HC4_2/PF13923_6/0_036Ta0938/PF11494_8/0_59_NODE_1164_length_4884_cov_102_741540_g799_i023994414
MTSSWRSPPTLESPPPNSEFTNRRRFLEGDKTFENALLSLEQSVLQVSRELESKHAAFHNRLARDARRVPDSPSEPLSLRFLGEIGRVPPLLSPARMYAANYPQQHAPLDRGSGFRLLEATLSRGNRRFSLPSTQNIPGSQLSLSRLLQRRSNHESGHRSEAVPAATQPPFLSGSASPGIPRKVNRIPRLNLDSRLLLRDSIPPTGQVGSVTLRETREMDSSRRRARGEGLSIEQNSLQPVNARGPANLRPPILSPPHPPTPRPEARRPLKEGDTPRPPAGRDATSGQHLESSLVRRGLERTVPAGSPVFPLSPSESPGPMRLSPSSPVLSPSPSSSSSAALTLASAGLHLPPSSQTSLSPQLPPRSSPQHLSLSPSASPRPSMSPRPSEAPRLSPSPPSSPSPLETPMVTVTSPSGQSIGGGSFASLTWTGTRVTWQIPHGQLLDSTGIPEGANSDGRVEEGQPSSLVERPVGAFAGSSPAQDIFTPVPDAGSESEVEPSLAQQPLSTSTEELSRSSLVMPLPRAAAQLAPTSGDTTIMMSESESSPGMRLMGVMPNGRLRRSMVAWMDRLKTTAPRVADDLAYLGLVYYMRRQSHVQDAMLPGRAGDVCRICSHTRLMIYDSVRSPHDCCPICLDRFQQTSIIRELQCLHTFHGETICVEAPDYCSVLC